MDIDPNAKPFAIQFYVEDHEAFKAFADQFFDAMCDNTHVHGARVTAIGREDVFTQLDQLEHEHGH